MVVRCEVPAAGVDDEAEGAQVAVGEVAREGAIPGAETFPPANCFGDQQDGLPRHGDAASYRVGEAQRRLEGLGPAAEAIRKDAVDLRQRTLRGGALRVEPESPRREQAQHHDHGLVVAQHERRQPVPRP